jgi:hypothetical protein
VDSQRVGVAVPGGPSRSSSPGSSMSASRMTQAVGPKAKHVDPPPQPVIRRVLTFDGGDLGAFTAGHRALHQAGRWSNNGAGPGMRAPWGWARWGI